MADHRFELHEMSVWSQIQGMAAAEFREHFGISVLHDRHGLRIRARRTRDLSLNRVYGLGIETSLTAEGLDTLIEEYKQAGTSRFMVSWAPVCRPQDAGHLFLERGFRHIPSIVRLTRRTDLPVLAPCDLRVVEATVADAEQFGELAARCNELPPEYAPGLNSTIGHSGWRHYFVLDGDRALAAAAMYADGDVAWAGLGGTLPADRRRGAQTALLARRVLDARAAGARWITSWATAESPDRPNQSLRNMKRLGFEVSYELENYVLDLRPA
jgi:GNAT superfamily N-acetyltransferase